MAGLTAAAYLVKAGLKVLLCEKEKHTGGLCGYHPGDRQSHGPYGCSLSCLDEWLRRYLDHTTYEISCPVLRDPALALVGQTGLIVSSFFDYSLTKHSA